MHTDRIKTLELLMASQSVWGTIESQFLMQRLTLVGANLLFLWTLSPIGGQASLRLMSRGNTTTGNSTTLRYMSSGPGSVMWGIQTTYSENGRSSDASALYTNALTAPVSTRLSPQDPWGNVKIPRLEHHDDPSPEWHDVLANSTSPEAYSSLVGIPIVGLQATVNSSFNLENTYLSVNCLPFNKTYIQRISSQDTQDWTLIEELVPGQVWTNKSERGNNPFGLTPTRPEVLQKSSFFLDTDRPPFQWSLETPENAAYFERFGAFLGNANDSSLQSRTSSSREPRDLLYASRYPATRADGSLVSDDFELAVTKCTLTQTHVETMIECIGKSCAARKIRKSLSDNRSLNFTGLEHPRMLDGFVKGFPFAMAPGVGGSSPTERFINNSLDYPFPRDSNYFGGAELDQQYVDVAKIPSDVFSKRLSLLLSTYYQLTTQPSGYWGSLQDHNLSYYGPDVSPVDDIKYYLPNGSTAFDVTDPSWWLGVSNNMGAAIKAPFVGATTTSKNTLTEEIFVCQFLWLTLLLICSSTILVTGSGALIMKRMTLGPEVRMRLQNVKNKAYPTSTVSKQLTHNYSCLVLSPA